jgi:cephalosporin hydroxylase
MAMGFKRKNNASSNPSYTDPNPTGPKFEINNWQLSEIIINKVVPSVGVHPFPLNEQLLMAGAIARFKPKLVFEWGTHIGKSARIFYEVSEALGFDTIIHSIDLPDEIEHGEHPHEARGKLVSNLKRVKLHQGDGIKTSLEILKKRRIAQTGRGALFLIDGDHSYDSVKRELSMIIKNAPEAAILLHDTFYQSPKSDYNIGPYKAINHCLKHSPKK